MRPVLSMEGGSIPIVADFKRVLGVESILMGFGVTSDAIHSPNESFHVKDFYRGSNLCSVFQLLAEDANSDFVQNKPVFLITSTSYIN